RLPEDTPEDELLALVAELNGDDSVDGILVQTPLPPHIDEARVMRAIDPVKDVDGLHPFNAGQLFFGRPTLVPATPLGIMRTLAADILVAGVGQPAVITADMVKLGAAIVDVGINRSEAGIVGDVDPAVADVAAFLTPVPGGVGPMTIASVLANAVRAASYRKG